jgi:hypothetical protein
MVLHDLVLPYRLPMGLNSSSPVMDPFMHRPFTWPQLTVSYINSGLVTILAVLIFLAAWRMTGISRK